ncbi:MAG: ABC transporter ATP-binding protein [Candidatus Eremiobacteraeota bacterium]|nr:ABC transporter ATP-binding protein [Candidatus Eremiobacteraeota bacterium]
MEKQDIGVKDSAPAGENYPRDIIKVRSLTKYFATKAAVNDLNFNLEEKDVFGLIGPNGAGKTTTLRILATVLRKDSGEVIIDDIPLEYDTNHTSLQQIRSRIGFMPDYLGVYDDLLVSEYLDFFARAFYIEEKMRPFVINEALEITGIKELAEREIEGLSRGMKQRLGLARILLHDPKILLLDEPAAGLDPRARVELREIIKGLRKKGKTIIISSHILEDIEDFCNKIGIIEDGHIIKLEDMETLSRQTIKYKICRVMLLKKKEEGKDFLASKPLVKNLVWEEEKLRFDFHGTDEELASLLKEMVKLDFEVLSFSKEKPRLEDVYLKFTERKPIK